MVEDNYPVRYWRSERWHIITTAINDDNDNDNDDNSNADTTGPVITITGDASESVNQDEVYLDPGATASDAVDGDVTTTASGTVDTSTVGSYTLTYIATDSSVTKVQQQEQWPY